MALHAIVHREGYSYTEAIEELNPETIQKSQELFELYRQTGIIKADAYDSKKWTMTDEVHKGVELNFEVDELHCIRETAPKLACSLRDYKLAMRLVMTSRFGYSLKTLQSGAAALRKFADNLTVPADYTQAQMIADLLYLLPGRSRYREDIQSEIDDISPLSKNDGQQRRLAHYQSYLRFADILKEFWETASSAEKILFFPVWFWFCITGVLPLRPTECVVTPRQCIKQIDGKYFLEVRRTKKKGTVREARYTLEQDYERCQYPIPKHLALEILEYLSVTESTYESDIDVLFCKSTQFLGAGIRIENDNHYTYNNLKQCLSYFYRNIIQERFGYAVVNDCDRLSDGEIEGINLGDMRHIAMIALAISGGSPSICKELAGHDSIEISSHYYSNLTVFLDLLGWERYREQKSDLKKAYGLSVSQQFPVYNGYCQCEQVFRGDFSACESAVNADGLPGSCEICRWYFPTRHGLRGSQEKTQKDKTADELKQTCSLLRQAIEQVRQGLGHTDTISGILDRLAAQSQQYIHLSTIERMVLEREDLL